MSMKSRLKAVKDKSGVGKPELLFFNTYYERREGGRDYSYGRAVIVGKTKFSGQSISSKKGESKQAFEKRTCDEVFEITGVRPANEDQILGLSNARKEERP